MKALWLLLLPLIGSAVAKPFEKASVCGYDSCPATKPGMLNVHIVAHSHDDVGWLKTLDQYYYGSKSLIQKAGVQYILDSVVRSLSHDPSKKFIYVESAFFSKWWHNQPDYVKHQVKQLVQNGQLEFIGGAWSMNDEAATHYQSTIDQFTWGLRFLNDTFGECARPKIGWQIDPFGHSREMASLFAQFGFDGLFFGRLDFQDKNARLSTKTGEMLWRGSASLGNSSNIFTGILYNGYSPPPGFCFDILCADDPIVDDPRSPDYNVKSRVSEFLEYIYQQARYYETNNVILTMGGDFTYMSANTYYTNLDKIIRYVNKQQEGGENINMFYSTPSCYLKAVHDVGKDIAWPVKTDDFFPYASDPHAFWTGYFTSRPTSKRFERLGNNYLQICKQLYALADLGPEDKADLNALREAMGVMQHHDAITGTEKQHVANDYHRILHHGIAECEVVTSTALNKLMAKTSNAPALSLQSCLLLNVSQCDVTEKQDRFLITTYNPLSRKVSNYVRVPVTGNAYTVQDSTGAKIPSQILPISASVLKIPGRTAEALNNLVFRAVDIPALGFKSFYVSKVPGGDDVVLKSTAHGRHTLHGKQVTVRMSSESGRMKSVKLGEINLPLEQDFMWYQGAVGDNSVFENRSSGAYIFRPNGSEPTQVSGDVKTITYKGDLVDEVHQVFNDWVSQVIRVYKDEEYIELDWLVGPIPTNDNIGKEIISTFTSSLKTKSVFYTDSNGREMLKRVRNMRPTWNVSLFEPVAGNYYPVTSRITMKDETINAEVAVLTDRAQGGSSLKDGQLELMVHRRLLHDDSFGVGEPLMENAFGTGLVARGQIYIMSGSINNTAAESFAVKQRILAQRKLLDSWTFVTPVDKMTFEDIRGTYNMIYSGLKKDLPVNVQVLTLEPWKGTTLLVRLEHILEASDDETLSQMVTINLRDLFGPFTIVSAKETTLGANQWKEAEDRMEWKEGAPLQYRNINTYPFDSNDIPRFINNNVPKAEDPLDVTLTPMQIRTFVVNFEKK